MLSQKNIFNILNFNNIDMFTLKGSNPSDSTKKALQKRAFLFKTPPQLRNKSSRLRCRSRSPGGC